MTPEIRTVNGKQVYFYSQSQLEEARNKHRKYDYFRENNHPLTGNPGSEGRVKTPQHTHAT